MQPLVNALTHLFASPTSTRLQFIAFVTMVSAGWNQAALVKLRPQSKYGKGLRKQFYVAARCLYSKVSGRGKNLSSLVTKADNTKVTRMPSSDANP